MRTVASQEGTLPSALDAATDAAVDQAMPRRLLDVELTADLFDRHANVMADLARYSVPLFMRQVGGGAPRQIGTGWFLRVADVWFLITAWHVLECLEWKGQRDADLLVHADAERMIPVEGVRGWSVAEDVGILKLAPTTVERGRAYWRPVGLIDADETTDQIQGGTHCMVGFPLETMRIAPSEFDSMPVYDGTGFRIASRWSAAVAAEARSRGEHFEFDEERHLLLPLGNEVHNERGVMGPTPALEGVSGAPVWRLRADSAGRLVPLLAGVEHRVLGAKPRIRYIMATRWRVVGGMVEQMEPGLLRDAGRLELVQFSWTRPPRQ